MAEFARPCGPLSCARGMSADPFWRENGARRAHRRPIAFLSRATETFLDLVSPIIDVGDVIRRGRYSNRC